MVNEALRTAACASPRRTGRVKEGPRGGPTPPSLRKPDMANPKPLMAKSSGTDHANAAVQSALRTLEAEGSGITALAAALQDPISARRSPPPPT